MMLKKTRIKTLLLEGKSSSEIAEIVPCTIRYADQVKHNLGIVNGTECMVEHHTHYKEIHGYDKTVWMTRSEHAKLHQRLRKNGGCNVPADKLNIIAHAASGRTDKYKNNHPKYESKSERIKYKRDYALKNRRQIQFREMMMPNIVLVETIQHNLATDNIVISSGFYGNHIKPKPLVIDIV